MRSQNSSFAKTASRKVSKFIAILHTNSAEVAQLAERELPKLEVAGSIPVFRSSKRVASTCSGAFLLWVRVDKGEILSCMVMIPNFSLRRKI